MNSTLITAQIAKISVLVLSMGVLFISESVHAAVLLTQDISTASVTISGDNSHKFIQSLGQHPNVFIGGLTITTKYNQEDAEIKILGCDNSTYGPTSTCTNPTDHLFINPVMDSTNIKTTQFFQLTTPFNPASQYLYIIYPGTGNAYAHTIYGSATDVIDGACYKIGSGAYAPCDGVADTAYTLYTVDVIPLQAQVYGFTSPSQFQVTSSATIPVSFTYLNTTVYNKVGVQILDQSNMDLLLNTGETNSTQNGLYTYSNILSLTANHAYRMRGYLKNSTSSAIIYGPYRDFSTITDQFFNASSTLIDISQITEQNASNTLSGGLNSFLALSPSFFADRFPFNWIFDIAGQLDALSVGTTTDFFDFGVTFAPVQGATTTGLNILPTRWSFLSTTTISTYLGETTRNTFRNLAGFAMILGWLFYMFKRVTSLFDTKPI